MASATPAYAKTPKPTLAQIQAAKVAEATKRVAANAAVAKLAQANQTLHTPEGPTTAECCCQDFTSGRSACEENFDRGGFGSPHDRQTCD
jgi:hypothetical protein